MEGRGDIEVVADGLALQAGWVAGYLGGARMPYLVFDDSRGRAIGVVPQVIFQGRSGLATGAFGEGFSDAETGYVKNQGVAVMLERNVYGHAVVKRVGGDL